MVIIIILIIIVMIIVIVRNNDPHVFLEGFQDFLCVVNCAFFFLVFMCVCVCVCVCGWVFLGCVCIEFLSTV